MSRQQIQDYQNRAELALARVLPSADIQPQRLHDAMRYSTLGGGKRLRPILVYATGSALGVALETLDAPACAVELIHAYSLIHDDLPAMDDDDLRRGKPTCHRAFDAATAILAGDAVSAQILQKGSLIYVETVGGTPDLITATTSPSFVPQAGSVISFKVSANNTAAVTLNVNGSGAFNELIIIILKTN